MTFPDQFFWFFFAPCFTLPTCVRQSQSNIHALDRVYFLELKNRESIWCLFFNSHASRQYFQEKLQYFLLNRVKVEKMVLRFLKIFTKWYLQWIDLNFKQSWILLFASYLCLCFDHWLKHCAILLVVTAKDNCIKLRWTLMEIIICNYLFESKWYPTISAYRSGCLEVLKNFLGKKHSEECLRNIVGYLAISAWHTCRKWVSGEPCLKGGVL